MCDFILTVMTSRSGDGGNLHQPYMHVVIDKSLMIVL